MTAPTRPTRPCIPRSHGDARGRRHRSRTMTTAVAPDRPATHPGRRDRVDDVDLSLPAVGRPPGRARRDDPRRGRRRHRGPSAQWQWQVHAPARDGRALTPDPGGDPGRRLHHRPVRASGWFSRAPPLPGVRPLTRSPTRLARRWPAPRCVERLAELAELVAIDLSVTANRSPSSPAAPSARGPRPGAPWRPRPLLDEPFSALEALSCERFDLELVRLWERAHTLSRT